MSIELLDQKAQSSEFGLTYEQAPINTRIPNLMKAAFPMSDNKTPKLFFKIRSNDSEKLDLAIEKFIATLMIFLGDMHDDLADIIKSTRVQVGHVDKTCIAILSVDCHEVFQSMADTLEGALAILNDTGFRATGSIGLGTSIKEILTMLDRHSMQEIKEDKDLKEINEKTNLFRLVTHGLAIKIKADIAKKFLKEVRARILQIGNDFINMFFPDKVMNFAIKALKGIHMRIKLTQEETYTLFKDSVGDIDLPDAADLIDELGVFVSERKLIDIYDNMPFVKEFIDSFHDLAKCDIEIGYSSSQRTASVNMVTQGIRELFDLLIQGFLEEGAEPITAHVVYCSCRADGTKKNCCGQPGCPNQKTCKIDHEHKKAFGQAGWVDPGKGAKQTCDCQPGIRFCCGERGCPNRDECGRMHVHK